MVSQQLYGYPRFNQPNNGKAKYLYSVHSEPLCKTSLNAELKRKKVLNNKLGWLNTMG